MRPKLREVLSACVRNPRRVMNITLIMLVFRAGAVSGLDTRNVFKGYGAG